MAPGSNRSGLLYFLSFLVVGLVIWNILLMTGTIKTPYNKSKEENMTAMDGPRASGVMPFDEKQIQRQSDPEKRKLMEEANQDYLAKYGSALGGAEKMKGSGVHMSAPVESRAPEKYAGASSMGAYGQRRREKAGANLPSKMQSASLPALKGIGAKPYGSAGEKMEGHGRNKFIYTEKIQAFNNGEKYKVKTAMTCAGPTINHLTDMVIDTCQAHCAHDPQCAAFAYNFRNGDCRTYTDCSRVVQDDEKVQVFSRQN